MHAAYLYGPRDLRLIDAAPDTLGPDEVRIAVALSGICGTDLHAYAGLVYGAPATGPVALGHEYSGRVAEVGDRVTAFQVGDRVTSIPGGPCSRCFLCRTGRPSLCPNRVSGRRGSWAPSLVVPAQLCWRIPDDVPDDLATLTEPLACAIRAVDRAELRAADRVCIIGAGARDIVVTEPSAYRRDLAARLGAEVVFEAVGLPATMEQAIALAAPGGTVLIAGVADRDALAAFRPQELFFKELTIRGTKGVTNGIDRALRWLGHLGLAPLITHTFPLPRVQEAVDLALAGQAGKILLQP